MINTVNGMEPVGVIRIEAENYKAGVNGVDYFDTTSGNLGGEYRPDEPVDIQATDDVGGGFNIGWVKPGEFLTYDISNVPPGIYDIAVRVATTKDARSFTLSLGDQSYPVTFDSTGGHQSWEYEVVQGVQVGADSSDLRIDFGTNKINLNYFEFRPQGSLPNTAPTIEDGITDVTVNEGAADDVISLFDVFADVEDADNALIYEAVSSDDTVVVPTVNPTTGELTIDYADAGIGAAEITVTATDTGDLSVQDTFTVSIIDPNTNTAPTTDTIPEVVVTEGAADTVIPLFDFFDDVQDPDTALTYAVTNNTNESLVTPSTIDEANGLLTLNYAATGTGSADITVQVTDSQGSTVANTFTVTINDVVSPPLDGVIRIEAEDYNAGVNGDDYFDTTSDNLGGEYRPDEPVDIQTTSDVGGGFNIGWVKPGEFLTYDMSHVPSGRYDIAIRVATRKDARSFTLSLGDQSYTITVDSTGGNQTWETVVLPGVQIEPNSPDLRIDFGTNKINLNYFELIPAQPDEEAPLASLNSSEIDLTEGNTGNALFTINYSDNTAIESDTIDNQDIQVMAPDGTILTTSLFSKTPTGDNSSINATYAIQPPTSGWAFSDEGTYTIDILTGQIEDTSGNLLPPQQFNLAINISDPPTTGGIPDLVVLEGADNSIVDLFAAFDDNQDPDTALEYSVESNDNPSLVATSPIDSANGQLTLDYAPTGTGTAKISVEAVDTSDDSTLTDFFATVVDPQATYIDTNGVIRGVDDVIRINAGGSTIYDERGYLFQADAYSVGGTAVSELGSQAIANTLSDALYQTQRQGNSFDYSIPVDNGNYFVNVHIVDWEATEFGQRTFDINVEGQSYYNDLDIYGEIRNAFLDGQNTAKVLQGPDDVTQIVAKVTDGLLDISFDASLNAATIAALEILPVDPAVLIVETNGSTQVTEGASVDSYTVTLATRPLGDVTVNLQVDSSQLSTNVTSLTFTSENWDTAQAINVTPVDDDVDEGIHTSTITHTATSADPNYDSIPVDDVEVFIREGIGDPDIHFDVRLLDTGVKNPTSGTFGPDGRLYVSFLNGTIEAYTFNDDYTIDEIETILTVNEVYNNNITGIAFNPYDIDPANPKLYASHNEFYANGGAAFPSTEFSPYSGQVSILERDSNGVWQLTPLVTGIGVSNHDHGVNGLDFDNKGDLFITVGSNTNAGVADTNIGGIDESPFTAAILKAEITKPDFNGNIQYSLIEESDLPGAPQEFLDSLPDEIFNPPADLPFDPATSQFWGGYVDVVPGVDVEVYASGLRNPYDQVFTTWGSLYATENNANGNFGDVSLGPYTQEAFGQEQPEELNLITEGAYYGSPNRNRGRTDVRQNIYFDSPVDLPSQGYTAPIGTFAGSTNGITEYRATTFGSQLRGNLLAQRFGAKKQLYTIELSNDGQQVDDIVDLNQVASVSGDADFVANGLDVLTGPGGAIVGIDFNPDQLTIAVPNDPSVTSPTAYDIYPWRAPIQGGANFIIGGVNFDTDPGDTRVFIGDQLATAIEASITDISETRIRGTIPDLSSQPNQLLDLFIQDAGGNLVSFIDDAFLPLVG